MLERWDSEWENRKTLEQDAMETVETGVKETLQKGVEETLREDTEETLEKDTKDTLRSRIDGLKNRMDKKTWEWEIKDEKRGALRESKSEFSEMLTREERQYESEIGAEALRQLGRRRKSARKQAEKEEEERNAMPRSVEEMEEERMRKKENVKVVESQRSFRDAKQAHEWAER